jgi:hypothetical protein
VSPSVAAMRFREKFGALFLNSTISARQTHRLPHRRDEE